MSSAASACGRSIGLATSPSSDINADRDRAIGLEVCVEPPLHHTAAGLVLEERRSRRECNRSKSGKSFLEYLTPVTLGSRAHGSSCDACLAWRTSCAEQEWDRLKQECDRLKPVLLWQDAVNLREVTCEESVG